MNQALAPSELILNPDGSIYHIKLLPDQVKDWVLVVGDPARVASISQHLDSIEYQQSNREFVSHGGRLGPHFLCILSTGIGTDNVEIVLNELDALVNIDFSSRRFKPKRHSLKIVRLGTSGSIHPDVALDSLLMSQNAFGLDTLMDFYLPEASDALMGLEEAFQKHMGFSFRPYGGTASPLLTEQFGTDLLRGNTLTAPGFYAPQGRHLRKARYPDFLEKLSQFEVRGFRFHNFEMETAAYYCLGKSMGHHLLSLNAIVADRIHGKFSQNPQQTINSLIEKTLSNL